MRASLRPLPLALGGLASLATAVGIGRFIYTPILPAMAEGLGLSKGAAGLIASANFIGYLAGAVLAAQPWLTAHPRRWLLAFLALSSLTTMAMAWGEGMAAYLALRFLGGVASAYVLVLASTLVLDRLNAAGAGRLSAVHFAGVGTGTAVSALLTWALSSTGHAWRSLWLWGGIVSLLGLGAAALLVPDGDAATTPAAPVQGAVAHTRLRWLTLAYGLFGFGYVITATFLVAIARGSPDARPYEPAFWLVLGLAAVPSVGLWLAAGRAFGIMKTFAAACLVEAVGVLASVASGTPAALLLASGLLGGTFMGITALGLMAARQLAPGAAMRWVAIATAAFGIGQIVGPVVAGYGFDLTGSFFLPSLLAAAALGTSALIGFLLGDATAA